MRKDLVAIRLAHMRGKGTQYELAERLGIVKGHLSDILSGRREPGDAVLKKLGLERRVVYVAKARKSRRRP